MSKFYVTFGDFKYVVQAEHIDTACLKTLKAWLKKDAASSTSYDTLSPPKAFLVSEFGFEKRKNDVRVAYSKISKALDKEM